LTYPTKPATAFDYVSFQAGSPTTPLPANQVAGDLANHKTSIDAIVEFSKLVQRSDGNLQNGIVRPESLSSGVLSMIGNTTFRGAWLTATAYVLNNIVSQSGNNYICIIAHTSGVFATDLAAGKWQLADTGFDPTANITFSGTDTFNGPVVFSAGVDMTAATPTVATKAAGNNTLAPASTAFVQAAVGKVQVQVFPANGTYTPSAGMVNCIIECWGGGGGGGGTASSGAGVTGSGGGGGAGSYSRKLSTAAAVGASKTVTIGAAGAAGTAGNNAGGAGGDTSVGSLCIGKGGSGGAGTIAASTSTGLVLGGLGGVAGTGDVTTLGAPGGNFLVSNVTVAGAAGASSALGAGGRSGGAATGVVAGEAGVGRASGGAGGWTINTGGTAAGGAGTAGYVVITEFCNQ
jgi:hypothetical protein